MSAPSVPWIDAAQLGDLLSMADAIDAVRSALVGGFDPAHDPPRVAVPMSRGHLLLMPSEVGSDAGVKVASVAPANPEIGRPRIQAVYVLMDAETLSPACLLDGTALTALRTPAISAVAADLLATPDAARVVVFGSGPQAFGHIEALRAIRPISDVTVVGRDRRRLAAFVDRVAATGIAAAVGDADAVAEADLVVCATSAAEPVINDRWVRDEACVVAVGSHEPDRRELPAELLGRATVVVEEQNAATREAGDVVLAIEAGFLDSDALVSLSALATGRAGVDRDRPRVFKSVGMPWEDLVVAASAHRRLTGRSA
ncbi:MAG TPA: ornithine cyclodeaminase family protein [Nocardioidaceae bacterium]|nr:ornithine cyclodeaminase family protein [Nocardioidaceae bacterium]